ncbi:hypothetical protein EJ08DRAFT_61942 [Tothia fuscella]|uniref:Uncharacterized protein n=1 Tax=Tothia fuscella TaxID=1048955 RepID=A0A9P4NXT8_9PEZI|nr:hypothetical protein EJ08DRAFT_61942 [Tothia fuscella]
MLTRNMNIHIYISSNIFATQPQLDKRRRHVCSIMFPPNPTIAAFRCTPLRGETIFLPLTGLYPNLFDASDEAALLLLPRPSILGE